jgi:hypothetical protein
LAITTSDGFERANPAHRPPTNSASSCQGCTDQYRVAAPDGEASTKTTGKSPPAGWRPSATAFVGRQKERLAAFLLVRATMSPVAPHL